MMLIYKAFIIYKDHYFNQLVQLMETLKTWKRLGEGHQQSPQLQIQSGSDGSNDDRTHLQIVSERSTLQKIGAQFLKKGIWVIILLIFVIGYMQNLGDLKKALKDSKQWVQNLNTQTPTLPPAQYIQKFHNHHFHLAKAPDNYKEVSIGGENNKNGQNVVDFKKIFWLQTDETFQVKQWSDFLVANNHIDVATDTGFQVRKVDNLNAYDWLSEQTVNFIKQVHLRSMVEMPVFELLRLALLYEHGGVSIRTPNIILMDKIDWIENLVSCHTTEAQKKILKCNIPNPQIFIPHRHKNDGTVQYMDDIIIAKPKAKILQKLLNDIGKIIQEGVWPYSQYNITTINPDTLVVSFPNIVQALLTVYTLKMINLCSEYNLQSFHESKGDFMVPIEESDTLEIMKNTQQKFEQQQGKTHMLRYDFNRIKQETLKIIIQRDRSLAGEDSILLNKLILAEGNKWLTELPRQTRKVHFCIVSLKPHNAQGAQESLKKKQALLRKQGLSSWNLVHFVQNLSAVSKKANDRTVLVNASIYQGLNLQRAVTKHCSNDSIIFLLDHDQTLTSDTDLETLAQKFQAVGTFAAYFNIIAGQKVYQPSKDAQKVFTRKYEQVDTKIINDLANSLRAFSAQTYLLIPYYTLCQATTGRYYDREVPLMTLIQFYGNQTWCENQQNFYVYRRLETLIDIPSKKILTGLAINGNSIKTVNTSRHEYSSKLRTATMCVSVNRFTTERVNIKNLVVYNNGREEKGLESRKGMPELIPRKIHQVWMKGVMPTFKRYLMDHLRYTHPDYEHFLWTEKNITRQNFPESYDLMQSLMKFDLKSPYNKMSMLSDLIRHEAVYRHGGFYLDLNYMTFGEHVLDKFLSYSVFTGSDKAPLSRADKNSGFFGASKQNAHIGRLINHRTLSSRNYFSRWAHIEAGPGLFGHSLVGQQELDETIFQVDVELQYPYYIQNDNKCKAPTGTPASQILISKSENKYFRNCSEIYSYAIGIDFFAQGASWFYRRW